MTPDMKREFILRRDLQFKKNIKELAEKKET